MRKATAWNDAPSVKASLQKLNDGRITRKRPQIREQDVQVYVFIEPRDICEYRICHPRIESLYASTAESRPTVKRVSKPIHSTWTF